MVGHGYWHRVAVLLLTASLNLAAGSRVLPPAMAQAQTVRFTDLPSTYWASGFVEALATRSIIGGFPDGTFQPDAPVTRSQFAAMIQRAFNRDRIRADVAFGDVPPGYWGYTAIQEAYTTGFMTGYPSGQFRPDQSITRAQVLVALVNGLGYRPPAAPDTILQIYGDWDEIPDYAQTGIAIATAQGLVVNFPSLSLLNPNRIATRAEVAAFLYQALVQTGDVEPLPSPYLVAQPPSTPGPRTEAPAPPAPSPAARLRIPAGTTLPTRYPGAGSIYLSLEEPAPIPLTLRIDRDIVAGDGHILIPINSQVVGQLQVMQGGFQLQTRELVLPSGSRLAMDAISPIIITREEIGRETDVTALLTTSEMGAAAAAGIAAVTGDRRFETRQVLGDVAVGSLVQLFMGREQVVLIRINPNTDLDVTLLSPLALP